MRDALEIIREVKIFKVSHNWDAATSPPKTSDRVFTASMNLGAEIIAAEKLEDNSSFYVWALVDKEDKRTVTRKFETVIGEGGSLPVKAKHVRSFTIVTHGISTDDVEAMHLFDLGEV